MCLPVFSDEQVREMLPWAGCAGLEQIVERCESSGKGCIFFFCRDGWAEEHLQPHAGWGHILRGLTLHVPCPISDSPFPFLEGLALLFGHLEHFVLSQAGISSILAVVELSPLFSLT